MIGIIIVQHDPCRGHGRYPLREYGLMAFSVGITAVCTVRNEYIVKHYMIALNVQNSVLYASGAALNVRWPRHSRDTTEIQPRYSRER